MKVDEDQKRHQDQKEVLQFIGCLFVLEKKKSNSDIFHSVSFAGVETSVTEFSRIFPEFSGIFDK